VTASSDGGAFPDGVDDLVADLRVDLEVAARRRERWMRQRLTSEATMAGALLASVGQLVALQAVTGDRVAGVLEQVGTDVVEVRRRHAITWVAMEAIASMEVDGTVPAAGPASTGATLVEALSDLCDDRAEVVLTLLGGSALRGELVAVGDVATIRTGPGGRTAYASVGAVALVSVAS
jgi:hypothetical protein